MTTTAQFRHERQHGSKLDRKAIARLKKKIGVVSRRFEKKFEKWFWETWYKGTKEYRLYELADTKE
jgi:hypothetical protein